MNGSSAKINLTNKEIEMAKNNILHVSFTAYPHPIHYEYKAIPPFCSEGDNDELVNLLAEYPFDLFHPIEESYREIYWQKRRILMKSPSSLPKILKSCPWNSSEQIQEAYALLMEWPTVPLHTALLLLDEQFNDILIRNLAVKTIENLSDQEYLTILLQLIQVLKLELYFWSPLAEQVVLRCWKNRKIAQKTFWALKSEMALGLNSFRFALILEAICRGCWIIKDDLLIQCELVSRLQGMSQSLKKSAINERKAVLSEGLMENNEFFNRQSFTIPFDEKCIRVQGSLDEKWKFMDSKKIPLWCVFKNNLDDFTVMFKDGDDLRQDCLTLQMLDLMDKMWKKSGLDLQMTIYECVSCGKDLGFIEIVLSSETVSNIQIVKCVL